MSDFESDESSQSQYEINFNNPEPILKSVKSKTKDVNNNYENEEELVQIEDHEQQNSESEEENSESLSIVQGSENETCDNQYKEENNNSSTEEIINDEFNTFKASSGMFLAENSLKSSPNSETCHQENKNGSNSSELQLEFKLLQNQINKSSRSNQSYIVKIFGIIIALAAIFVYQSGDRALLKKQDFTFDFDQLKQKYPNQTDLFWTNIESSFKHSVLKSKDPSIILIVYDQMTEHVYQKISRDIVSHLIKNANLKYDTNDVTINPKTDQNLVSLIQESRVDKSKLYIDAWLDNNFKARRKIVLVEDIQSLPAHSMFLFYSYGDDMYNAKHPGVMIFMSLKIEQNLDEEKRQTYLKGSKILTKFAEDYMFNLWSSYIKEDQLKPLFTRIANNVIFLNLEN